MTSTFDFAYLAPVQRETTSHRRVPSLSKLLLIQKDTPIVVGLARTLCQPRWSVFQARVAQCHGRRSPYLQHRGRGACCRLATRTASVPHRPCTVPSMSKQYPWNVLPSRSLTTALAKIARHPSLNDVTGRSATRSSPNLPLRYSSLKTPMWESRQPDSQSTIHFAT